ncbi:MAG TPA: rhomboid family intramembrane serine protease [Candidatus Xenobia bacterium]|nr:rhomboid family intramembrane serine protease [Candidatus Xenobia bacterium]
MSSYRSWGRPSYRSYGAGFGWGLRPTRVVKQLLILNTVLFVALALLDIFAPLWARAVVVLFGVVPIETVFSFRIWQPLTYLFLHSGFWHLFFNMFALWMFGTPLERDWGSRRFLRYYLLTGVGAGVLNVLVSLIWGGAAANIPTIGASGAIYGLLLAFGVLYPRQPIFIWFVLPVPAWIFVSIYGGVTFLSALQGPGSGISHVSHLGGMLFGLIYLRGGWLLYRGRQRYAEWKLGQAKRKFEVYMREQDEQEDRREPPGWVN